jgi:hypothetical protein
VLLPDELLADLFTTTGRPSVPPQIVATVMVPQRLFRLSDREAVEAFEFDARWKYACGGLALDHPGFVHTVLVDMRARWPVRIVRDLSSKSAWYDPSGGGGFGETGVGFDTVV